MAEVFASSDGETTVERVSGALRVRDGAQVGKWSRGITKHVDITLGHDGRVTEVRSAEGRRRCWDCRAGVGIDKAREIDALGPGKIQIARPVGRELLRVAKVCRVG